MNISTLNSFRLSAAFVACCLLPNVPAYADQNSDEFTSLMMQGLKQYKEGQNDPKQYEAAIASFEAAKKINPIPEATYNIARAYHNLGKCEDALAAYREYANLSAANAESVRDYIQELSAKCSNTKGILMLRCTPESTRVSIDSMPDSYCVSEQKLDVGTHNLVFSADGYRTETRTVTVSSDSRLATPIVIELQQIPTTTATTNTSRRHNDRSGSSADDSVQTLTTTATAQTAYATSDFDTVEPVQPSDDNSEGFSKLFWSGVGLTGGGVLLSVIGGVILGYAYSQEEYYISKYNVLTVYEKNDAAVGGGAAMLAIGSAATLAGLTCFILDRVFDNKSATSASVTVDPYFSFNPNAASAGISMTF